MEIDTTDDAVLGGRLCLRQPKRGHRVGHDAILLAAATDAHAGEHAIDLGAGVGAAGLALAHRVAGLAVTLLEIDPALAALAAFNAEANGLADRVRAQACDVEQIAALADAGLSAGCADRVLMNPPFHDVRRQNVSPDPRRRLAHVAAPGLLSRWVASGAWLLKPQGVLTLIWRADGIAEVTESLSPVFGDLRVRPVLPRPDAAPIRILVRAAKDVPFARADCDALLLNDAQGRPTAAAEALLRGGETLSMSVV